MDSQKSDQQNKHGGRSSTGRASGCDPEGLRVRTSPFTPIIHPNRTLVLDATYRPIGTTSWQKAVCLYWTDKANIIEEYDWTIHSPSVEMQVPAVIRLANYTHKYKPRVRFSRRNIYIRDNGECQYCRKPITYAKATLDHVIPRVSGGRSRWENIVIACPQCNEAKGHKTPREAKMRLVTPKWPDNRMVFKMSLGLVTHIPPQWENYLEGFRRKT